MISLSQYYEENLYPLQNGVLRIISSCKTRFYLTGGTALSRAYYNHRYSDDLDFFVNNDAEYNAQADLIFDKLKSAGFLWDTAKDFVKDISFRTIKVRRKESGAVLKLDFVNDSTPHFGDLIAADFFDRIDSIRNILSNKMGAVFRMAGKDVADIREIALHETVDWTAVIHEARQKDAGIDLLYISEILKTIPRHEFDAIHWVSKPGWQVFKNDIDSIVFAMMGGTA
jgi:predicted nucleotidyltransferase component of viral defense system